VIISEKQELVTHSIHDIAIEASDVLNILVRKGLITKNELEEGAFPTEGGNL
jgi:hypothetical protein